MIAHAFALAAALTTVSLATAPAIAQTPARPARIAFMSNDNEAAARPIVDAFRAGLAELGQVEGRNYQLELRYAQGQTDHYPASVYSEPVVREVRKLGHARGAQVTAVEVRSAAEFDRAMAQIRQADAEAVFLAPDAVLLGNRAQLVPLLLDLRVPVIGFFREFTDAGALLSYSSNRAERFHRLAWFVDRILKSAKPTDLPVEQLTKFELVVNLKTAKALGITIPQSVLLRADEVIE